MGMSAPARAFRVRPEVSVISRLRLPLTVSTLALLVLAGSGCPRGDQSPASRPPASPSGEGPEAADPEVALPDTEAGGHARELVALLHRGDADAVEPFVTEHFAPGFRDAFPMEAHRGAISSLWNGKPGLTLRHVLDKGENGMQLYLQSDNGAWVQVSMVFEAQPPHRIASVMFGPTDGPPDPVFDGMDPSAVTAEQRAKIVARVDKLLRERYVEPHMGAKASTHVSKALADGAYSNLAELEALAERLTTDLQSVTNDKHLHLRVTGPMRAPEAGDGPKGPKHGVHEAQVLAGNIGYLELHGFAPAAMSKEPMAAAMKTLADTDAIIFDLRNNGGGAPDGVQYLCSYLFDEKTHLNSLYWRDGDRTEEFWTLDEVDGAKRPNVPVFVLTSGDTFSAGEEFVYNLQTRKRATVVGETTGGGANPGGILEVAPQLGMFVPTGKAINPVTNTNWEGVGVKPDVEVPAGQALESALKLAKKAARKFRKGN